MKTLLGVIALLVAAPVAAQTAPVDPHSGHAQHQGTDHGKTDHGQHKDGHEGHGKDCCKDGKMACCEKMKQQGKEMDCCKKGDAKRGNSAAASHEGNAH